ncbi:hypothetical protein [Pseudomonas sp. R9.37]|uniref:hypothetical protein n=1 Tax=Pseudomonas sp. R9.37 TaxID=1390498 RepID=UPI000D0D8C90|nr:hypothetical protein [Pseudomonas sp. R9.37]PSL90771.1 hypothetical protein C7U57_28560 [Pseudomonas sp. R9.37]
MNNYLIAALVVMAIPYALLIPFTRQMRKEAEIERESYRSQLKYLTDACQQAQLFQSEVTHVLQHCTGGIVKRLNESSQIVHSIQSSAPELFQKNSSLLYCLHANDQFLARLYSVAGDCLESDVAPQDEQTRGAVFIDAYESAGLAVPPFATHQVRAKS